MAAVNAPLGQLVELIGLPLALRLVDNFGGVPIYLPHPGRVKEHSPVAQVIGAGPMRQLAAVWPMTHVMVPRGSAYLRRQRNAALRADAQTMSQPQLARKYEMSLRNVEVILSRPEDDETDERVARAQGSLFGDV